MLLQKNRQKGRGLQHDITLAPAACAALAACHTLQCRRWCGGTGASGSAGGGASRPRRPPSPLPSGRCPRAPVRGTGRFAEGWAAKQRHAGRAASSASSSVCHQQPGEGVLKSDRIGMLGRGRGRQGAPSACCRLSGQNSCCCLLRAGPRGHALVLGAPPPPLYAILTGRLPGPKVQIFTAGRAPPFATLEAGECVGGFVVLEHGSDCDVHRSPLPPCLHEPAAGAEEGRS